MRIIQVIPHYIPAHRFGGPLRVAHPLGKALTNLGHQVVVCTTNLADEHNDLSVPVDQPVNVEGVTVYYEPTLLSRYWGFSPKLWRRSAQEIQKADLVLVHAHYQFANWAGAFLARRYRKPYIIFPHASLRRQGLQHKSPRKKQIYLTLLERRNLEKAMFIAFNAPEEKADSLFGKRGRVVPSGIDPSEFNNRPASGYFRQQYPQLQNKVVYLFLGRLDVKHKGLDFLIPAFAQLHRSNPNTHLVLAGPDEDDGSTQIDTLIHQHNLSQSVTLTGLISGQDKLAALQDADVFVLSSRFEGLSIALLEALYFGLPMLVTDRVGLCHEIQRYQAGLVTSATTEAIYQGLSQLAEANTRKSMKGRGTHLILKNYTWDIIASNLMSQIQDLVPECI